MKYVNFDGLSHFLEKLLAKVTTLLNDKVDKTDILEMTDAEIDEICGADVVAEDVSV